MELNTIETQILLDVYEADINFKEQININNYTLNETDKKERKHEFAAYLLKLKRLKYIDFDEEKTFIKGGCQSPKYHTNVIMFWTEYIHITEKGIKCVENIKKTVLEKSKEELIDWGSKVYGEIKDWGTKTIAEIFIKNMK
ncbi:hypothetical protein OW763_16440 [Clostridium aestuarii]|uniref:DUF2513 domain-containing protein n=1 Tax=Clostridium aestuarii TaxID=338193 RepID=A0ABT4D3S9_9CLOT|nr:hypothetical protein [Clostridium aestuarii]MCY6485901.1 hypothetical protein [Clostridium aestuarii]